MLGFCALAGVSAAWSGASAASSRAVRNHVGFIADGKMPLLRLVWVEDVRIRQLPHSKSSPLPDISRRARFESGELG
jgi:hypothetical protein